MYQEHWSPLPCRSIDKISSTWADNTGSWQVGCDGYLLLFNRSGCLATFMCSFVSLMFGQEAMIYLPWTPYCVQPHMKLGNRLVININDCGFTLRLKSPMLTDSTHARNKKIRNKLVNTWNYIVGKQNRWLVIFSTYLTSIICIILHFSRDSKYAFVGPQRQISCQFNGLKLIEVISDSVSIWKKS